MRRQVAAALQGSLRINPSNGLQTPLTKIPKRGTLEAGGIPDSIRSADAERAGKGAGARFCRWAGASWTHWGWTYDGQGERFREQRLNNHCAEASTVSAFSALSELSESRLMNDVVWISQLMSHRLEYPPMLHSFLESDREHGIQCGSRNDAGEPLGPECFPEEIWLEDEARKTATLPDICFATSFWFVSSRCAEVMNKFDLGSGALYPVKVLQNDRVTPVGSGWFCLNFGNVKHSFLPEQSSNVRPVPGGAYRPKASVGDGDLAFSAEAASGADIWLDPLLRGIICLSDPLVTALSEINLKNAFQPIQRAKTIR